MLIDELTLFPFREQKHHWRDGESRNTTPFSELIELYDFIHEAKPDLTEEEPTDADTLSA